MRSRSVCSSLSSWNQCVSIPMVLMAGVQDIFRGAFMMTQSLAFVCRFVVVAS